MKRLLVAIVLLLCAFPAHATEWWQDDEDAQAFRLFNNPQLVSNITQLEAQSGGYTDGMIAKVLTLDAYFIYHSSSTATVDHITVASVSGAAGARWERMPQRSFKWEARTVWYVDPASAVATCSDENDGASSGAPLCTFAELGRRDYGAFVPADITINLQSSAPASDPLILTGVWTNAYPTITVTGRTTVLSGGRTISTPHAPASQSANDHYEITDGTATFTPWIQANLLHKTNGTQAWFWPYKDLGGGKLHISQPVTAALNVATLSNGDTYEVLTLPTFADVIWGSDAPNISFKVQFTGMLGASSIGVVASTSRPGFMIIDRSLLTANPFVGNDTTNAITFQNICLPASAGGMSMQGNWASFAGLYAGNGTTTALSLSGGGFMLGGNTTNLMTLGGISFTINHHYIAERMSFNVFDWAGSAAALSVSHESELQVDNIGGERNSGQLLSADVFSRALSTNAFATWNDAITSNGTPFKVIATSYTKAQLGAATNQFATRGTGIVDIAGSWAGHLSGIGTDPNVIGLLETGGPTSLLYAAIPANGYMKRNGANQVIGVTSIPATDITGLFYQTIQNGGSAVTQRPIWNASTGLTAVDNGGSTRTDVTVNLSTGIAGGQSAIGGTAASENLTLSSTTNGTKGKILFGTSAYDEVNNRLIINGASTGYRVEIFDTLVGAATMRLDNSTSGGGMLMTKGATSIGFFGASGLWLGSGATDIAFGSYTGKKQVFFTNNSVTSAMELSTANVVNMSSLAAGGIVKAKSAATAGDLAIAVAGTDYQAAITWPAAKDVLISTGTSTAPTGTSAWQYDSGSGNIALMGAIIRTNFNLGGPDFSGNYEGIVESWNANVWSLKSSKGGTGTVRNMKLDADTATLTLNGATNNVTGTAVTVNGTTDTQLYTALGTNPDILIAGASSGSSPNPPQVRIRNNKTVASAAGATWDGIYVDGTGTLSGSTNVTNASGFNGTKFAASLITSASALTVSHAATVAIASGPTPGGSVTITNPYALWIQGGTTRTDGGITPGAGAACTLANSGGSGPTTAAQLKWIPWNVDGQAGFIPFWK